MNDVDDSDHELTDEQRDKLRKAIGEIIMSSHVKLVAPFDESKTETTNQTEDAKE